MFGLSVVPVASLDMSYFLNCSRKCRDIVSFTSALNGRSRVSCTHKYEVTYFQYLSPKRRDVYICQSFIGPVRTSQLNTVCVVNANHIIVR